MEKCEGHFFFFLGDGPHIQWYGTGPLPLKFNNQNKKERKEPSDCEKGVECHNQLYIHKHNEEPISLIGNGNE